jgi:hypothetical protein
VSNNIGGFQSQNGTYPVPSSTAPVPKKPSLPTWEIAAALGATTVAVAGGVYACRNSSKSSNTAWSSLGHDSIDASGDNRTSSGQNYGQAQIKAQQAQVNQPDADSTARGASAPIPAEDQIGGPNGHRIDIRDIHSIILAHLEPLPFVDESYRIQSFGVLWHQAPETLRRWEGPFRNEATDLDRLLNLFNAAQPIWLRRGEANFTDSAWNEVDYFALLNALDGNHSMNPMILAQQIALQLIEENRRRAPNNGPGASGNDPADGPPDRLLVPPSWEDLFRNEPMERPGPTSSGGSVDHIERAASIADTHPASESEQRIHKFRLWRAAGKIHAIEEISNWKNRNENSWRDAQIHARQILHDAHKPEIGEDGKPTGEFGHPLLRTGNDLWLDPSPAENEDLLRQLHEKIGYYTALGQYTWVNRKLIPSEIDLEQGLGRWFGRYQSVLVHERETWPVAGSLLAENLSELTHNALYQSLYDADADRDLGTTDARKVAEGTQPSRVNAVQAAHNNAADIEFDAQRLVGIEQNLRTNPSFVLDEVCRYDLDFLRARRTHDPEFAGAVRRASARAARAAWR